MARSSFFLTPIILIALSGCGDDAPSATPEEKVTPIESETGASPSTEKPSTVLNPGEPSDATPSLFPDYVGKPYEEAKTELDVYGVRIDRTDEESVKPPGTVIRQEPAGGADFDSRVALVVAVRAPGLPDVSDMPIGQGTKIMDDLDFAVSEIPIIDESVKDGTIVSQDPAPGTENVGTVTLTVARRPVSYTIGDLDYVDYDGYSLDTSGTFEADGEVYGSGAKVSFGNASPETHEFNLSRDFVRMDGAIGISDDSPDDARAKVEVIGDDRELFSTTVKFGETVPFDANVSGVLRLKIRVAPTDEDMEVVLGDWRILGFEEEVDEATSDDE